MHRLIARLAVLSALAGGVGLCALVAMTCTSVAGRALSFAGLGPVPGDFELMELGTACIVFAFLPLALLRDAHATVDLAAARLPPGAQRWLRAVWDAVMAAVMLVILWRLQAGMQDKLRYGEVTFLLRIPVWWAYAAALVPGAVAAVVALWLAAARIAAAAAGREFDLGHRDAGI